MDRSVAGRALAEFLSGLPGPPAVLTGAGMSTDSGIPDYRGPNAPVRRPMTIDEFRSGPAARQRYWARSHLGWQQMRDAVPNAGHVALAALARAGRIGTVITQNVDGLHQRAGTGDVIDLHGRLDRVVCLDCRTLSTRQHLHERLDALNPGYRAGLPVVRRPDGDVELADTADFRVAACRRCGGVLKPDVVFFGENAARDTVQACYRAIDRSPGLLVLGSSLAVQSGLRFVRRVNGRGDPVAIVNLGVTRGDHHAAVKLDAGCTPTLVAAAQMLGTTAAQPQA